MENVIVQPYSSKIVRKHSLHVLAESHMTTEIKISLSEQAPM